jgi:hypothetical protein
MLYIPPRIDNYISFHRLLGFCISISRAITIYTLQPLQTYIMQFVISLLQLAAVANAATISILVAESGLTFTPSNVTAEVGDM